MPLEKRTTLPAPLVVNPSQSFEGSDGSWSTFQVGVGTPSQNFHVLASTRSSETWVVDVDGCTANDPSTCPQLRGAQPFNGQASKGFETNASSSWDLAGLYSLGLEQDLDYTGNGRYGYDVVALNGGNGSGGGVSLNGQVVAGVAAKDFFLGIFGLGIRPTSFSSSAKPSPSFLQSLRNNNLVPSLSYGFTAGAVYRNKQVFANLVLGGYDQSRFRPTSVSFSFGTDAAPLTIGVQSIVADNTLLGTASFTATSGGHLSVIDSTVPHLWLPPAVCDQFVSALGLTYDNQSDLYLVNDTMHAKLTSLNPSFTFKLGNTQYDTGNFTNIILPYSAFDLQVGWPIYSTNQNYFPIRRGANDTQYTLGRSFLQEAYLVVDHERRNFTVGQAIFPDPLPAARIITISPNGTSTSHGSSGLGTGAIAGIAVAAGIVALVLLAALIWFLRRKKQTEKKRKIAELADTEQRRQDTKQDHKYDNGPIEVGAGQDHQISELAGGSAIGPDHKDRPQSYAELDSPAPVFEMLGDTQQHGGVSQRGSMASSPLSRGPSPYQPSPNTPQR